jgi:hypothetical protein
MQTDFHPQNYLMVCFDVLGQRESLRSIKQILVSGEEKGASLQPLRENSGKALMLRDAFSRFFNEAESYTLKTAEVPRNSRAEFLESQKASYRLCGLSDAFVVSVPLLEENENCTAMIGLHSAFAATCGISLLALFLGVPARGGLDIGVGTELQDGEIYGPALERALMLESRFAEYPRFLAGNESLSYLGRVFSQKQSTYLGQVAQNIAELCKTIIIRDTDGCYMLDFLGQGVKEVLVNSIDKDVVDGARKFVESQYRKYAAEDKERLASRYYRLLRYFESRKSVWEEPQN